MQFLGMFSEVLSGLIDASERMLSLSKKGSIGETGLRDRIFLAGIRPFVIDERARK